MAAGFKAGVRFRGVAELQRALKRLGKEATAREAAEEDLLAAAEPIVVEARANAPRSAHTRGRQHAAETIHAAAVDPRGGGELARVRIGPSAKGWFLRFAELGTRYAPAQPWLRPAMDAREGDALKILGQRIARRLRDIAQRVGLKVTR